MSFIKLILKNPFRRRNKAILSIIGIIISTLLIISLSFYMQTMINIGEDSVTSLGDFMVKENDSFNNVSVSLDGVNSNLQEESDNFITNNWTFINKFSQDVGNINGVNKTIPILIENVDFAGESMEYLEIIKINISDLKYLKINLVNGNLLSSEHEVMVGKGISQELNKNVGDTITISNKKYTISGIFGGSPSIDYSLISSQDNIDFNKSLISDFYIPSYSFNIVGLLDSDSNNEQIKTNINKIDKHMIGIFSAEDIPSYSTVQKIFNDVVLFVKIIGIIVGAIIINHTMITSVNDRRREIGVLKAVGWNKKMIIAMIIGESLVLCILGLVIGIVISIIEIYLFSNYILFIKPVYDIGIFLEVSLIVLAIGLLGSILSVLKATSRLPIDAMKYE